MKEEERYEINKQNNNEYKQAECLCNTFYVNLKTKKTTGMMTMCYIAHSKLTRLLSWLLGAI